MSAPQTARERFEAWFISEYGDASYAFKTFAWLAWQAAERSMNERAAKVADGFTCGACGMDGKAAQAIRSLIA